MVAVLPVGLPSSTPWGLAVRRTDQLEKLGLFFVALFALMLMSVPRMSVKFGSAPLYFIDLVILGMFICAARIESTTRGLSLPTRLILVIFVFAILSELKTFVLSDASPESAYTIIRTVLAFSVFYSVSRLVRSAEDFRPLLQVVSAALIFNSLLLVLTSLPMTRPLTSVLFTSSILEPAAARTDLIDRVIEAGDTAVRGRTLVGVSILAATFSNVAWPFAALLSVWPQCSLLWRIVAMVACLLAPFGVLMSYSRGPIIGSILIVAAVVVFRLAYIRRGILAPVLLATMVVVSIGISSDLFFFSRLINRTNVILAGDYHDERESERLYAYIGPFEHVLENPTYLFLGDGINPDRAGVEPVSREAATHALFASAYYAYGLMGALLFMSLVGAAILEAARGMRERHSVAGNSLSQALFASLVAMLPWFAFGHAMITSPSGSMLMFFVLGLLAALDRLLPRRSDRRLRRTSLAMSGVNAATRIPAMLDSTVQTRRLTAETDYTANMVPTEASQGRTS
jgi:hypothetical protein